MTETPPNPHGAAAWPAPYATKAVAATVALPGSKSLTNRELVLAGLADGPGTIRSALRARDTELMAAALTSLGAEIDTSGPDWSTHPIQADRENEVAVDCGLAGTVMRFVPLVAALRPGITRFDGDPYARQRPMGRTIDTLHALGVEVESPTRTLPLRVTGTGSVRGGVVEIDASASSQFVSALLLAGPRFTEGVEVHHVGGPLPSLPHIDMTIACLRNRGVEVETLGQDRWRVAPGPIAATEVMIEPDLSNAAPFLMLALTSGGSVTVPHWPAMTTQAGDALRGLLTQMGAEVTLTAEGLTVRGARTIDGINVDLHDVGELVPAVAALCALARTPSRIRGVAHIRGHETDRLHALTTELRRLGADVTELNDGLSINPSTLHGGTFRTYADHRMAHAAVVIGSAVPGVLVEDIATTAKTYPGFELAWAELFTS